MLESASLKARNKQMPLKRKPEDELPLPEKAVKKTKASSAADGDHGDYDKPEDGSNAARPKQNSWQKWLEDSILHSGESLQEVIGEDSIEEFDQGESLQEVVGEDSVEEFDQGDKGKGKEEEVDVDTEGIGKPCESKQTWESKGSFDPILDIYTLNEAVQLQRDLENLESELLVIRDRIPWVCDLFPPWSLNTLFYIMSAHTRLMPSWCRINSNKSYVNGAIKIWLNICKLYLGPFSKCLPLLTSSRKIDVGRSWPLKNMTM